EVAATDEETMVAEGRRLAEIAENVAVKVPLTWDGLKACRTLSTDGIMVNVTLCFSANQALLAAKAGAAFVSPFIGRLDDIGEDGMALVRDIRTIYDNYPDFGTEILAASIRHPRHVTDAALAGADIATVPPAILKQLVNHPLTEKGLAQFVADWKKTGQSIL
ncbi:MAG TPA: transaldolase family protein, partial [Hyphomicrobiales bacterium]|nr:transaldolase family protein [Hyphomicrobiales bacterium]